MLLKENNDVDSFNATCSSSSSSSCSNASSLDSEDELCMLKFNPWSMDSNSFTNDEDDDSLDSFGNSGSDEVECVSGLEDFSLFKVSSPKRNIDEVTEDMDNTTWMLNVDDELIGELDGDSIVSSQPSKRSRTNVDSSSLFSFNSF